MLNQLLIKNPLEFSLKKILTNENNEELLKNSIWEDYNVKNNDNFILYLDPK